MNSKILRISLLLVSLSLAILTNAQAQDEPYRVVAYFSSYSIYDLDYFVTDINPENVTHINYRPFTVSENGQCITTDEWADTGYLYPGDDEFDRVRGNVHQLQMMRGDFPDLKLIMSVGGWELSRYFSDVALDEASRLRFAKSCIALLRNYDFDGIDIDWRYPVVGGAEPINARPADTDNYVELLKTLREELDNAGDQDERRYILTALIPSSQALYEYYDLNAMHPYLDWLNVATYGYTGAWSEEASPHAPLYQSPRDPRSDVQREIYNIDGTVNAFLDAGVPANKIVMGVGFYAQTWSNVRQNDIFGLYESASGIPTGTRPNGILYYRDLEPLLNSQNYTKYFDDNTKTPWMYNAERRIAVSYENPRSIQFKTTYAIRMGLGGMMIYELGFDDPQGTLTEAVFDGLTQ